MYYFIDTSMRLNNNLDHIGRDTYIHTHGGDETKKKKKKRINHKFGVFRCVRILVCWFIPCQSFLIFKHAITF